MSIIEEILDATAEMETPRSFVQWAVMAAFSAVMKKKVWYPKAYNVYPNIYVLLVAKPAAGKGFATDLAKKLVKFVDNTKIISGRNSIQSVITELANAQSQENNQKIKVDAATFLVSGELATFLIEDPAAHTILTDWYDTHYHEDGWENTLKSTGKEKLDNLYVTMLAASNPTLLYESVPPAAFGGGFIGRIMIVEDNKRRTINSMLDPPEHMVNIKAVGTYLRQVASLNGPFHMSPEARKMYKDWYDNFDLDNMEDRTGAAGRMRDHIIKVAMILSVADRLDLCITEDHMRQAMDLCLISTKQAKSLGAGIGKQINAQATGILLRALCAAPDLTLSRNKLLRKHYADFDAQDLSRIIETLSQSGTVMVLSGKTDGEPDTIYRLNPKIAEEYQMYFEQERKR